MFDRQTAFTRSVKHLLKQGQPALDNRSGAPMYRTDTGLTCAIGCLIPKDRYLPEMEDKNASSDIVIAGIDPTLGRVETSHDLAFLSHMQRQLHDIWIVISVEKGETYTFPKFVEVAAACFARDYNLLKEKERV